GVLACLSVPSGDATPLGSSWTFAVDQESLLHEVRPAASAFWEGLAMAIADGKADGKGWGIFRLRFFGGGGGGGGGAGSSSSNSSSTLSLTHHRHSRLSGRSQMGQVYGGAAAAPAARRNPGASSISSVARSLLPTRRRLRLDPTSKLYFPCEFLFRCFKQLRQRAVSCVLLEAFFPQGRVSLQLTFFIPLIYDDYIYSSSSKLYVHRDIFLKQMEKLKRQLAEAEAAVEARKKPPEDTGPRIVGEGLVIDEWKERRERYLARQQVEGVDSV
ncbi:hypothetical protein BHM03_00030324, partial [Ensete ventricosum]